MNTYELMLKVKEELEARGFSVNSHDEFKWSASAVRDGKSEWRAVEGWNHKNYFGIDIRFNVVHRHNGTEENKSVDIAVYSWDKSSGHRIARERVNVKMGDKAIKSRVDKIVAVFEEN